MTDVRASVYLVLATLVPVAARAQQVAVVPATCQFDTAARTDTLTLDFSLRAFRGDDTLPDTLLTRGFGAMIGSHFTAPSSIGQLLYPNTYNARLPYRASAGTLQFTLQPDGTMRDLKWAVPSTDPATDAAIEQALHAAIAANEPRDLAVLVARKKNVDVRIRFAATSATTLHAALLRLRAPMVRVDSLPHLAPGQHGTPFPREMLTAAQLEFEGTVNEQGVVQRNGIQIVRVGDLRAAAFFVSDLASRQWIPARAGDCPVSYRMAYRVDDSRVRP